MLQSEQLLSIAVRNVLIWTSPPLEDGIEIADSIQLNLLCLVEQIAVMPTAYKFRKGNRVRLEIVNGDSQFTELVFHHDYTPDRVGQDTINHNAEYPSYILLPVVRG